MTDMLIEKFTIKKPTLCEVLFFPSVENEAKIVEYNLNILSVITYKAS